MALSNQAAFYLDLVVRFYKRLPSPRMLVTALDQSEIATLEGDRYTFNIDSVYDKDEERWYLVEVPAGGGFSTGLLSRTFKTKNGAADLEVRYDFTLDRTNATIIGGVINQRVALKDSKPHQTIIEQIPVADISDQGVIGESDFTTTSGVGSNTSGGVSSDVGFRIYDPGTKALVRVVNSHTAQNRINLGYTFVETSTSISGS